jgi:hypothetical protein
MLVGSFVMMKVPTANKLDEGYEGPYRVVNFNVRQTIAVMEDGKSNQCHVSLLAPLISNIFYLAIALLR